MTYEPIITRTAIIVDLKKPIYGSFFGIWDKWLKIAKQRDLNIIVNTPFGKSTFTYKTYMNGAKKLKRFYKNPNVPMIFFAREFASDIQARDERKQNETKKGEIRVMSSLMGAMTLEQIREMREKIFGKK